MVCAKLCSVGKQSTSCLVAWFMRSRAFGKGISQHCPRVLQCLCEKVQFRSVVVGTTYIRYFRCGCEKDLINCRGSVGRKQLAVSSMGS